MTTPSERIQGLVQKGVLPAEEASALLAALGAPAREPWARRLLDPLEHFGTTPLLLVGLGVALGGCALERVGLAFDGLLDLHISQHPWQWAQSASRALVAWPFGALVLWLASLLVGRRGRFVDFLALVGTARVATLLCALPIAGVISIAGAAAPTASIPRLLVIAVFGLASLVGWLVLAYRGFGTASGLRGAPRVAAFVIATLLAELASKPVLMLLGGLVLPLS